MREPAPGDIVYHLISVESGRALVGVSEVAGSPQRVTIAPPNPGVWANFPAYYRIPLQNYSPLIRQPMLREIEDENLDSIRQDIFPNRPKHHPYATYGVGIRLAQGLYLGRLTNRLIEIFDVYTGRLATHSGDSEVKTSIKEYQEGERYRQERIYFARNAALRNDAIQFHGLRCAVCDLHFGEKYGAVGQGFIEVHHVELVSRMNRKPNGKFSTTVNDVRTVCANCHRMLHRRSPPYSVEELKAMLRTY
jgi:hypothetical protein